MAIKEANLQIVTISELNDYLRTVTSKGESRNILVSDLAKTVIENYRDTQLIGEYQSVAAAFDSILENLGDMDDSIENMSDTVQDMSSQVTSLDTTVSGLSDRLIALSSDVAIDSEVTDLYESIGWDQGSLNVISSLLEFIESKIITIPKLQFEVGECNPGSVSSESYKDVNVTFRKPFTGSGNPHVIPTLYSTSTSGDIGAISISAINQSNTGFTARYFNGSYSDRSPGGYYFAFKFQL